jgi:uncharacterized protein (TIGR03083 family)
MVSPLQPLAPVPTAHLFPDLHAELMALLRALAPGDWERPTGAGAWTVRDVVAHLLDGDCRKLTFHRDGLLPGSAGDGPPAYADLLAYLNRLNADWVEAAKRIGPRLLVDFHALTGPQVARFVQGLDPHGRALFAVAWAGESESANWLDTGREYTERWHHQQQIREAVGWPLLVEPRWLRPVLEVSVLALPRAYQDVAAPAGTSVGVAIDGPSGGAWTLRREAASWRLWAGEAPDASARVSLDEDAAWRLFFKRLPAADAQRRVRIEGDARLGGVIQAARAVMA